MVNFPALTLTVPTSWSSNSLWSRIVPGSGGSGVSLFKAYRYDRVEGGGEGVNESAGEGGGKGTVNSPVWWRLQSPAPVVLQHAR